MISSPSITLVNPDLDAQKRVSNRVPTNLFILGEDTSIQISGRVVMKLAHSHGARILQAGFDSGEVTVNKEAVFRLSVNLQSKILDEEKSVMDYGVLVYYKGFVIFGMVSVFA